MSRALVTGGAGFIGSHLVDRLLEDKWEVIVLDSMLTGQPSNLSHQKNNQKLQIVEGDIRDFATVKKVSEGCDAVFHMAAHALMRVSLKDHKVDLEYNVVGTLNVLEAMIANAIPDFVFASTSALYGESEITPTPEQYTGMQTSLYGAAKLADEAFAQAYTQLAPIKVWSYRFGTVLGERCRRGAIWDFVHKLEANPRELEILGDGNQKKDYLYVKDCVDGILLGYEKSSKTTNIFNLGLQELTSVNQLADIVISEMGLHSVRKKFSGGARGWIGDNPIVHLDVTKIKTLGWKPDLSAEQAITLTTKWTMKDLRVKDPLQIT
ncbi:MAG: SDR family NAD(P)-dependent oxidoreductase [Nitrososphaerales archaeon]